MDQIVDQVKLIFVYGLPAFLLLIAVEYYAFFREGRENREEGWSETGPKGVSRRDSTSNVATYLLRLVLGPLEKFMELPIVVFVAAFVPWTLPANQWWTWVLALVLADLAYYVKHRMGHRIRLFWAEHSVHHSSQYFNLSTSLRLPWLIPGSFLKSVVYIPMVIMGIPVWLIFLCQTIVLIYQFPIHTERIGKLPRAIEYVFNTPSHHRVHHGSNNPYLDKNYGGILIVWDRMFGSYAEELEQVRYGLTKNINTYNPIKLNFHEFAVMISDVWHAKTWRGRVGYLLRPPGWQESADANDREPAYTVA